MQESKLLLQEETFHQRLHLGTDPDFWLHRFNDTSRDLQSKILEVEIEMNASMNSYYISIIIYKLSQEIQEIHEAMQCPMWKKKKIKLHVWQMKKYKKYMNPCNALCEEEKKKKKKRDIKLHVWQI